MTSRREFMAALLAGAALPPLLKALPLEAAVLPLMKGPSPAGYPDGHHDGFCLTVEPARAGWREHGLVHLLKAGDLYPAGFTSGWVAHGCYDGEWSIRWHDGKTRHAHLHRNDEPCVGRTCLGTLARFYPLMLGEALYNTARHGSSVRFTTQEATAMLARWRNRPWWQKDRIDFA